MNRAALKPAAWIMAGVVGVGMALPAAAHAGEEIERPLAPGGGGGAMRMMSAPHGGHKHFSLVAHPVLNMANNGIYTLLGMEMVKQDSLGWKGGFGMYGGLNTGIQAFNATMKYGGVIFGKDFTTGPFSVTSGVLVGFGSMANVQPVPFPNGISDFWIYGVAAPRLGLAWTLYERLELGLDATYLFTTRPSEVQGPGVLLRLSTISWGHHGRR